MIKFFRKIRHKLLSENKFSKYVIYAIGEIILVVIGILIALSINNWNEHKKKKQDERVLLMAVLENLKLDSLGIANVVHNQARILEVHKKLIGIVKGSNTPGDIDNLGLLRRSLPTRLTLKANYPDLPNQVLDETVKSSVMSYFLIQNGYDFTMNNYNNILEESLRPYLSEKQLLNFGNQLDDLSTWINEPQFYKEFQKPELQQLIFNVAVKLNLITEFSDRWMENNDFLKKTIISYLDKQ